MPGAQTAPTPLQVWKVNAGAGNSYPLSRRLPQNNGLTIKQGTPVNINASGYLIERTAISSTAQVIAGFTTEPGANLSTAGTAPVGGSGTTFGSVANQTSAVNIPIGAPMADGNLGIYVASDFTEFGLATDSSHTTAAADLGSVYGLTKDATSGLWFIDTTITTTGSGACVEITDFIDTIGLGTFNVGTTGGRLAFRVVRAYQQLYT